MCVLCAPRHCCWLLFLLLLSAPRLVVILNRTQQLLHMWWYLHIIYIYNRCTYCLGYVQVARAPNHSDNTFHILAQFTLYILLSSYMNYTQTRVVYNEIENNRKTFTQLCCSFGRHFEIVHTKREYYHSDFRSRVNMWHKCQLLLASLAVMHVLQTQLQFCIVCAFCALC